MAEPGAGARPRRWPLVLGLLALLAGGAALLVRFLLDPQRVSDFLLERAGRATGLELKVAEPAGIGLLPHLAIELYGFSAHLPGEPEPLLTATFVEIALPWEALRSEQIEVGSLRLDQARLDWAALQRWQAQLAESAVGPPEPLRLPPFDAPMRLRDSAIRAPDWQLSGIDAQASPLREGLRFELAVDAVLQREDARTPFSLRLGATPSQRADGLALAGLTIESAQPALRFEGSAELAPPQRIALSGTTGFEAWPETLPALLPDDGSNTGYALQLDLASDTEGSGSLAFSLARGAEALRGRFETRALLAWLGDPDRQPLPPLQGEAEASRIELPGVGLKGVTLRAERDAEEE